MKNYINKSAKRVLSVALALAMVIGTLFTANLGTEIVAGATAPIAEGTIDLLEFGDYLINDLGSTSKYYDTKLAEATKKARKFVRKARVLVDERPQAVLNLPEAKDYR